MAKAPIRLLVVEDEVELLDVVSRLFTSLGFQVKVASDGQAAWTLCESEDFDIVLSDVRMPGLDGLELLKRLKARNADRPKVVMMSGYSDIPISKFYAEGADGFFEKPFSSESVRQFLIDGLVPNFERWAKYNRKPASERVSFTFRSFDEALRTRSLKAGRQGFFQPSESQLPMLGTFVDFEFHFRDSPGLEKIEGQGIVRFHQSGGSPQSPAGFGVEILQLELGVGKQWVDHVRDWGIVASIPES